MGNYSLTIPTLSANDTVPTLGLTQTFTQEQIFNGAGAASTPTVLVNGTTYAGAVSAGVLIQPSTATALSTGSASGTGLALNMASGFAGNLIDGHVNNAASVFSVSSAGAFSGTGYIAVTNGAAYAMSSTGYLLDTQTGGYGANFRPASTATSGTNYAPAAFQWQPSIWENGAAVSAVYRLTPSVVNGLNGAFTLTFGGVTSPTPGGLTVAHQAAVTASELTVTQLANPSGNETSATATTGGTVAAGTYYGKCSYIDYGGNETSTQSGAEATQVTTGSTSTITWTCPTAGTGEIWYKFYVGTSSGGENYYFLATTAAYTETVAYTSGTSGTPPVGNSTGTATLGFTTASGYGNPINLTVAAGAAAGTSPTIACATNVTCGWNGGTVNLLTGTSPTTGALFTVTDTLKHGKYPSCVYQIESASSSYVPNGTVVTTGFYPTNTSYAVETLNVSVALSASSYYVATYVCGGV